jgi:hypothetical protein
MPEGFPEDRMILENILKITQVLVQVQVIRDPIPGQGMTRKWEGTFPVNFRPFLFEPPENIPGDPLEPAGQGGPFPTEALPAKQGES